MAENGERSERGARILAFLELIEGMKHQTRTAWTTTGRRESVAEHSWRLAMLALALGPDLSGVNCERLVQICLVHDLGETLDGDVSATEQSDEDGRHQRERAAVERIAATLGGEAGEHIVGLWQDYEEGASPEARVARAIDKLETIFQHNQGANPPGFDYWFNLSYGAHLTTEHEIISRLRELADAGTRSRAADASR